MAKWQDIVVEKPKEKKKQNYPFIQSYNDYGFNGNNVGMYSLPEENRDFRKHIENEIKMEELKTQNILGNHITDEADRTISEVNENTDTRAEELTEHISERTNYIINTLSPKIQTVENKVDTVTTKVNESRTVIDRIWNKVETLRNAVIG